MFLEMYLNGLHIDRQIINFDYAVTHTDRTRYLELLVQKFERRHKAKIRKSASDPVYFIDHVQSKMNTTNAANGIR
jgi:hypothetical protein